MGLFDFFNKTNSYSISDLAHYGIAKTSEERKKQSENYLRSMKFKVNPYLPTIEDSKIAKFQSARNIAVRTQILGALTETAFDFPRSECKEYLEKLQIWNQVSPEEKAYLLHDEPSHSNIVSISWRIEACYTLYWSLGLIKELPSPNQTINLHDVQDRIISSFESQEQFFNSVELRNREEILDECDFIYRLHNSVRSSVFNNAKIPHDYNPSIIYERHYALNWVTCYQDNWDEVTTDT